MKPTSLPFLQLLSPAFAQPAAHLDAYIQQAFQTNQNIRQQQFLLERNLYALREAQSLFQPTVNLAASYFVAGGGRTIDFTVGDLLNPIYRTLNQMAGADRFPQPQNQRLLLNPNNFYDVHLRTSYPLAAPTIDHLSEAEKTAVHQPDQFVPVGFNSI